MKQGYNIDDLPQQYNADDIRHLYDQYADKLLGYLLPVLNSRQLAEDCIVKVFTNISSSKNAMQPTFGGTWNRLVALANKEIESLGEAANECKSVMDNTAYIQSHKYLNRMNQMQRLVFCQVYYHRKTTTALANELNLPEQELRLRLKEAFMIIREVKDES